MAVKDCMPNIERTLGVLLVMVVFGLVISASMKVLTGKKEETIQVKGVVGFHYLVLLLILFILLIISIFVVIRWRPHHLLIRSSF